MLKNGRAATSAMLIGLLIFQVSCLRPMNPPAPLRPADPDQQAAIQDADRIKVWTLDEQEYRLVNAAVAEQGLTGEWYGEEIVPIPIDSIAGIQVFNRNYGWLYFAVTLTAGVTALIVALVASMPGCVAAFC